jgi:hypothetical protein
MLDGKNTYCLVKATTELVDVHLGIFFSDLYECEWYDLKNEVKGQLTQRYADVDFHGVSFVYCDTVI